MTGGKYSIDPLTGHPESGGTGTFSSNAHQFVSTPIDASLKLNSQFLDKKLLLDVMVGTHYQKDSMRAADGSKRRRHQRPGVALQRQLAPQHPRCR